MSRSPGRRAACIARWPARIALAFALALSGQQIGFAQTGLSQTPPSQASVDQRRLRQATIARAVAAIAADPGAASTVTQAALRQAPGIGPALVEQVSRYFPGLAGPVAAAAGLAPPFAAPVAPAPAPVAAQPVASAPLARAVAPRDQATAMRLASQAIAALALDPSRLDSVVGEAVAQAPEAAPAIVAAISRAYPMWAPRIAAAAGAGAGAAATMQAARPAPSTAPAPPRAAPRPGPQRFAADASRPAPIDAAAADQNDPIEPFNRAMFALHDTLDVVIFRPLAWGYNKIVPDPVIGAVRKFFLNLKSPVIFANDLLQFDIGDAAVTAGRFGLNTTIGILGLFDPASSIGLQRHHADFGQTLASYGLGEGGYLMIPVVGPSSFRDAPGRIVDVLLDPLSYILTPAQGAVRFGSEGVSKREELLMPLDDLRENAIDYYAAVRTAYRQTRAVELNKGRVPKGEDSKVDELFDAAE